MKCSVCGNEEFETLDIPQGYTQKYQTTGIIMDAERFVITGYKTKKICANCRLELIFDKSDKKVEESKPWFMN